MKEQESFGPRRLCLETHRDTVIFIRNNERWQIGEVIRDIHPWRWPVQLSKIENDMTCGVTFNRVSISFTVTNRAEASTYISHMNMRGKLASLSNSTRNYILMAPCPLAKYHGISFSKATFLRCLSNDATLCEHSAVNFAYKKY